MKSGSKIQLGILGGNSQISRSLVPLLAGDYAITLYSRAPAKLEPFLVDHPRVENCHLHEFGRQPLDLIINSIGCGDPAVLRETGSEVVDVTRYYDDLILRHLGSRTLGYIYLSSVAVYGPTTKFPVGLTRKSDAFSGIQPFGSADSTAVEIMSLIRPGVYFLPLRLFSLCWVETTTLVQPIGLPST